MSDSLLDPLEMEAIQAAIRETSPRRSFGNLEHEPTRLALIADDRIAEAARPVLLGLGTRWLRSATRALRAHLPGQWQIDVVGAEVIDGSTAKEELRGGWVAGMRVEYGDEEGDAAPPVDSQTGEPLPIPEMVLAVHGGVVDLAAAKRCGAATPAIDSGRPPSAVSLRLFQPAGRALLDSFGVAWREVFPSSIVASSDLSIVSSLIEAQTVIRMALSFGGNATGRVQLYARPEFLVPRPAALAAVRATAEHVASALANVEVEVVVELGTLRLPLSRFKKLAPGATFTLQNFVDSRVPVYCGGALKAWAKPVVCRGVLAAQIETVIHGQGIKS
ncbi:MAG TPA: FliM/FliN family flagellar motor C-terminal domain-containing protein [Kofleriaceae bacterium]|nr:FliM/FliN family flagellar motor C-terminal domain-containing protein [Kofleriaceae bacterium]